MTDMVNHPPHYTTGPGSCSGCGKTIECLDIVKHMDFCEGNAMKYLFRYRKKGGVEDLKKAVFYINTMIEMSSPASVYGAKND